MIVLLKDLCTKDVIYCPRDHTIRDAARLMRQRHVGALVVVNDPEDDSSAVGLITDRDIAVKVVGNGLDASHTLVGDIMHTPLVTASESEDSSVAIARMKENGVRRLPIMGQHDVLIGIVTLDDLLKHLRSEVESLLDIVSKERNVEEGSPA